MYSEELDTQVPTHRNSTRSVQFRVNDAAETDSAALVVVRIVFERGGGRRCYVLKHIEDIAQFYPKELGRDVIDGVLTLWAERLLKSERKLSNSTLRGRQTQPPRGASYAIRYEEL